MSNIKAICRIMDRIAPLKLAEKWDNVGLMIEAPGVRANANRILLTIDLTTAVTEEALATPTSCIITYHPPIFKPLTSLTLSKPLQANLLRCAASNISVYCPHTSLDSVNGGINDWLTSAFGEKDRGEISVRYIGEELEGGIGGQARLVTLPNPISMKDVERKIKKLLKLEQIQVAYLPGQDPSAQTVRSIGICAGSGGDMLLGAAADVYFTGEMAHHDVLTAVASGHNVVLCGHTNTERGYLPILAQKLSAQLKNEVGTESNPQQTSDLRTWEVYVSKKDKHPLQIV